LPKPTQFVLALSDNSAEDILLPGIGVLYHRVFRISKAGIDCERQSHSGQASSQNMGDRIGVIRKTAVARFTRTLSVLISSGVPILHGLEITARLQGTLVIQKAVDRVRKEVSEGAT
jgi:type IV pilus assembly protein PilC